MPENEDSRGVLSEHAVALVHEACQRNVPMELHRRSLDGSVMTARGRMLRLQDGLVLIESPQTIGTSSKLKIDEQLDAFFNLHGDLYTMQVSVESLGVPANLNDAKRVTGAALRPTSNVREGQRRAEYRTSLISVGSIATELCQACIEVEGASPIGAHRTTGRLINASSGGLGIVLDGRQTGRFPERSRYFVRFCVGDDEMEFPFLSEVRYVRLVNEETMTRLGVRLVQWPDRFTFNRRTQSLTRYLKEVERATIVGRRAG